MPSFAGFHISGFKVGEIIAVADKTANPIPAFTLECDGSNYAVGLYPELYAAIGTTYGGNPGVDFNVPDYRGRSPMGADPAGAAPGISVRTVGDKPGEEDHTLIPDEHANHTHGATSGIENTTHTHTFGTGTQSHNHTHTIGHTHGAVATATHHHTSGSLHTCLWSDGYTVWGRHSTSYWQDNYGWTGQAATIGGPGSTRSTGVELVGASANASHSTSPSYSGSSGNPNQNHYHSGTTNSEGANHGHTINVNTQGNNQAHNTVHPSLVTRFVIAYK